MKKHIMLILVSVLLVAGLTGLTTLTGCFLFNSVTQQPSNEESEAVSSEVFSSEEAESEAVSSEEASSEAEASESEINEPFVLEGVYKGADWGDYLHLNIEDEFGTTLSFFVLRLDADSVDVEALEEGQRIRIEWISTVKFMDPPGEEMVVDEVTHIEIIG